MESAPPAESGRSAVPAKSYRLLIALPLSLHLAGAAATDYSNGWILPAYAGGHEPQLDFSGNVVPPLFSFFPPMAGWCEGKTASIGSPLVVNLGEAPQPVVHFLGNPQLDDQVTANRVRVCLSGYSTLPPQHDQHSVEIVRVVHAQASQIGQLQQELGRVRTDLANLSAQIGQLQGALEAALQDRARLQKKLGQTLGEWAACRQANAALNGEIANLRSQLQSCRPRSP